MAPPRQLPIRRTVTLVRWFFLQNTFATEGKGAGLMLGRMYENGRGVAQAYSAAIHWYRKAADHGDAAAQFNLGTLYGSGRGVAVDHVEAYQWLTLASSRFSASDEQRSRAIQNCTLVASKMTGAQIAEAQIWANAWKPT